MRNGRRDGQWDLSALEPFVFERGQYEAAQRTTLQATQRTTLQAAQRATLRATRRDGGAH